MKTWNEVISYGLYLYTQRDNITYCLGCSGEVVGRDKIVENQFKYYYDHGWKDKIGNGLIGWNSKMNASQAWNLWAAANKGKMAMDCSGFIDMCLGYFGNHKYTSSSFGSMPKFLSVSQGYAGGILWKEGHVGLDIGYGYELEIGAYNQTLQLNNIGTKSFTQSIRCTEIDYKGADAR